MDCSSGCLNVSGNLSKRFSLIGFTVCLYGQGESVGVIAVVAVVSPLLARPGPGRPSALCGEARETDQIPARQSLAVIGPIL